MAVQSRIEQAVATETKLEGALGASCLVAGVLLILAGVAGYALGYNDPEKSVVYVNLVPLSLYGGAALALFGAAVVTLWYPERVPRFPSGLFILGLAAVALGLVGLYARQVSGVIAVRADLVNWSESPFVDHIIRFRAGQPQFTPPADANAYAYTPGAPLFTYWIASLFGRGSSIPFLRLIQQLYLLAAALFAFLATRDLLRVFAPGRVTRLWAVFGIPFLFLVASNPVTNVFVHTLHNDALALLIDTVAFWLLVRFATTENARWLLPMAVIPALAYLVKQKDAVWASLYLVYLVQVEGLRWRRLIWFAAATFSILAAAVGVCVLLWGNPFVFWTFSSLGSKHVSLSKTFEQLYNSGWYVGLGLVGGAGLLRDPNSRRVFALWTTWLVWLVTTVYTSGISYRPAHLGPVSLVAAVWFLAAIVAFWPDSWELPAPEEWKRWLAGGLWFAGLLLFFSGGQLLRVGSAVPSEMDRYLREIEQEFESTNRERILLDWGSWVYLPDNIVMKDRASPIAVLLETGHDDFSATIERIRKRHYDKIIARKLTEDDRVSQSLSMEPGIRAAIVENYREVRVVRAPKLPPAWLYRFLLPDRSVFVPIAPEPNPEQ